MPSSGNIRQFIFDLSFLNKKSFQPQSDKIIQLTKEYLITVLEEVFEEYDALDNIIIEKLELDLGQIDLKNPALFIDNFRKQLIKALEVKNQSLATELIDKEENAILFFIEKGYYPWWVSSFTSFNKLFTNLSNSFQFSDHLIAVITSNQRFYYRLMNALDTNSKKIFHRKILQSKANLFEPSISFFSFIANESSLKSSLTYQDAVKEIEFYFIKNSVLFKGGVSAFFFEMFKHFSNYFSLSFSELFSEVSQKLSTFQTHSMIEEFFVDETKKIKESSQDFKKGERISVDSFTANWNQTQKPISLVIQFLEEGIKASSYTIISEYKRLLDVFLDEKSKDLILYLSSEAFYSAQIKLERLVSLLSEKNYKQLINLFKTNETEKLFNQVDSIFSDKTFLQNLSIYKNTAHLEYSYKKALLSNLFKSNSSQNFIKNFITDYSSQIAITKEELIFEIYKIGEKSKFREPTEQIIERIYASTEPITLTSSSLKTDLNIEPNSHSILFELHFTIFKKESYFNTVFKTKNDFLEFIFKSATYNKNSSLEDTLIHLYTELQSVLDVELKTLVVKAIEGLLTEEYPSWQLLMDSLIVRLLKEAKKSSQEALLRELILKLLTRLPKSKGTLENLIGHSLFIELMSIDGYKLLFRSINSEYQNELEKLITQIDDKNVKLYTALLYEVALHLLISKGSQSKASDFHEDLVQSINSNYHFILANEEKYTSQEETLAAFVVKNLKNDSATTQEFFIGKPSFLKYLSQEVLSTIFTAVKKESSLDIIKLIDSVFRTTGVVDTNQRRLSVQKEAVKLLFSKGMNQTPEDFYEDLLEAFFESTPPDALPISALKVQKESRIKLIVNHLKNLPDSRKALKKLLGLPASLRLMQSEFLSSLFLALKKESRLDVSNLIEKVIRTAEVSDKEELKLSIQKRAVELLVSKGLNQTSESVYEILLETFSQSEASENLALPAEKIQKENTIELIINHLKNLPNSRNTLENFLALPSYLKLVSHDFLSSLFLALKKETNLDLPKLIARVLNRIEDVNKNQYTLPIQKVALDILISGGLKRASDAFLEEFIERLIKKYPLIFSSKTKKRIDKKGKEDSLLISIINRFKEAQQTKYTPKDSSLEIEKFNSLLRLKQSIQENSIAANIEKDVFNFNPDLYDIIASPENLIEFLNSSFHDHELIMSFSEISFEKEFEMDIKQKIDSKNDTIFLFEDNLIRIQKKYNLVALDLKSFQVILRTHLLRKIGAVPVLSDFSIAMFTIDFFENLRKENYINYQQLLSFLRLKNVQPEEGVIFKALTIFNTKSVFSITNPKLKNEMFFKDLVFYYLTHNDLPSWSPIENFEEEDVILFFKKTIQLEDKQFLSKLLGTPELIEKLTFLVSKIDSKAQLQFIRLISLSSSRFNISLLIQKMVAILENSKLSTTVSNQTFIVNLILSRSLWQTASLITFIEKIYSSVFKQTKFSKNKVLELLAEDFNIPQKLYRLEKKPTLSKEERSELLKYYVETKSFPDNLKIYKKELEVQLKDLLAKDDFILLDTLIEYSQRFTEMEQLLSLIPIQRVFDVVTKNIFSEHSISMLLGTSLSASWSKDKRIDQQAKIIAVILFNFKQQVTSKTVATFLKEFQRIDEKKFNDFKTSFLEDMTKIKSTLTENEEVIAAVITSSSADIPKEEKLSFDLSLIDYYLEIGSVSFENKSLTKTELFDILISSLEQDRLTTKKMIFEWAKAMVKLKRLIALIPSSKRALFIEIIHPDLFKNIQLFSSSLVQLFSVSIEEVLKVQDEKEFDVLLLRFWSQNNIFIDSSFEIILPLFNSFLINRKMSEKEFFQIYFEEEKEFPLEIDNFIKTLKKKYDNQRNRLSQELGSAKEEELEDELEDSDSIVIQNAGLVLLWPFLFRLFDKCGLLMERKFKDDISIQKAILMMQYLVTGSLEIKENDLVLNKILCGVPKNSLVDVTLEISAVELEICDSLLKGVLQNWKKLGNSSVATLRETFLIREGVLAPVELDYNLSVVKGTFDMLIETVPWNISMIQTAFMKNRINVDWKKQ